MKRNVVIWLKKDRYIELEDLQSIQYSNALEELITVTDFSTFRKNSHEYVFVAKNDSASIHGSDIHCVNFKNGGS